MTRRERYEALLAEHFILDDVGSTAKEDAELVLAGDDPDYRLDRFAVVTANDEHTYVTLRDSFDGVAHYATNVIDDDVFAEHPNKIVDLDTGKEWKPMITITWKEVD